MCGLKFAMSTAAPVGSQPHLSSLRSRTSLAAGLSTAANINRTPVKELINAYRRRPFLSLSLSSHTLSHYLSFTRTARFLRRRSADPTPFKYLMFSFIISQRSDGLCTCTCDIYIYHFVSIRARYKVARAVVKILSFKGYLETLRLEIRVLIWHRWRTLRVWIGRFSVFRNRLREQVSTQFWKNQTIWPRITVFTDLWCYSTDKLRLSIIILTNDYEHTMS